MKAYRLIKRFQEEGIVGLEHKNKNKPFHNCCNKEQKQKILNLIKEKYYDCDPSYASELINTLKIIIFLVTIKNLPLQ